MGKETYYIIDEKSQEQCMKIKASSLSSAAKIIAKRKLPSDFVKGKRKFKIHVMKDTANGCTVKICEVTIAKFNEAREVSMKDGKVMKISKEITSKIIGSYKLGKNTEVRQRKKRESISKEIIEEDEMNLYK